MKVSYLIAVTLMAGFLHLPACSSTTDANTGILRNQTGTLVWSGSPARDGAGILFVAGNVYYGAPGNRDDYSDYFPEDENEVRIKEDIRLTGEISIRGWGSEFPEIKFLRIEVL